MLTRERLTEEQQSMVDRIVRSSKSLLAIVNEILDFSKIEAGQIDLDELPINLTDLLQNISDTQRMMATEKGLRFHAEIPEHLLSGVLCDAIRIEPKHSWIRERFLLCADVFKGKKMLTARSS